MQYLCDYNNVQTSNYIFDSFLDKLFNLILDYDIHT